MDPGIQYPRSNSNWGPPYEYTNPQNRLYAGAIDPNDPSAGHNATDGSVFGLQSFENTVEIGLNQNDPSSSLDATDHAVYALQRYLDNNADEMSLIQDEPYSNYKGPADDAVYTLQSSNNAVDLGLNHCDPSSRFNAADTPADGDPHEFNLGAANIHHAPSDYTSIADSAYGNNRMYFKLGAAGSYNASSGYHPEARSAYAGNLQSFNAKPNGSQEVSFGSQAASSGYSSEDSPAYGSTPAYSSTGWAAVAEASSSFPSTASSPYEQLGEEDDQTDQPLIINIKKALQEPFPLEGTSYHLHCRSEADFHTKFQAYLSLHDKERQPTAVDDFPADAQTQKQLVSELVEAMVYLGDDCVDRESKTPVNRIMKLAPLEFDFMAWTILLECREIQNGKISMPRWGTEWEMEAFPSFRARFQHVKRALRARKAMVASCFDHVFAKRLVANPTKEEKTKRSNKEVNTKRALDLGLARTLKNGREKKRATRASRDVTSPPESSAAQEGAHQTQYEHQTQGPHQAQQMVVVEAQEQPYQLQSGDMVDIPPVDQEWMNEMLMEKWREHNSWHN